MKSNKSLLSIAVLTALGCLSSGAHSAEKSATVPGYTEAIDEFVQDATLSAAAFVDTRIQKNKIGEEGELEDALNYTDYNLVLAFQSGFTGDNGIGVDLTGLYAGTLDQKTTECTEISYCSGWSNNPSEDGTFKFTKAAIKYQLANVNGDFGYTDMGVGTLGNVWGYVPGTYRGAKIFAAFEHFNLGYAFVDSHTATWQKTVADSPDGKLNYKYIHAAEITGNIAGIDAKLGLGYAKLTEEYATAWKEIEGGEWVQGDDDSSTSLQIALDYWGESFSLGYDVYMVNSERDYAGLGAMHGLKFELPVGGLTWNSELQYTHLADATTAGPDGFANRMVAGAYSTNAGTFSLWWDAMSDFNQNQELAWFNKVSYSFDNGIWLNGGVVLATIGDDQAYMDKEWAVNGNIGYTVPTGNLKGSTLLFHVTHLNRNEQNPDLNGGWYAQSQQDFRLQLIMPYNFI
ncbi:porin [Psychromonas sp. psych-6C06]|uniref:porin n=1 Tax=Psychromonas sp. psych-6C06 TaxID=2058089 RepID=UPI000C331513|nr:porin [Psychromonas sp. psych-6C06]PKF62831.1 porin [Psychromonas sp. psych-6C06]